MQMMWTGECDDCIGSTSTQPIVKRAACAASLRRLCNASSPTQTRAMAYGLSGSPDARDPDLMQDLASFLLIRGPYAWLGWGWVGCSVNYFFPPEFNADYGEPTGLCRETAPGSEIFTRDFSKSTVQMDCHSWKGAITMK
jgi:hypothetical protein